MLILLIASCIVFLVYELALDRFYKKDLQNEKLISYFSNTRMQLIKMLYMKEISHNSCYFNFMIRATSYSIRTIYYKKKKLSMEQLECLESMFNVLNTDNLKNEFLNLNSEQKELFAKTALKIVELYFNREFIKKLLWGLYILRVSSRILKYSSGTIEKISSLLKINRDEDIRSLNDIEKTYKLSQYAFV